MDKQKFEGSLALNERQIIVIDAVKEPETRKLRVAEYSAQD